MQLLCFAGHVGWGCSVGDACLGHASAGISCLLSAAAVSLWLHQLFRARMHVTCRDCSWNFVSKRLWFNQSEKVDTEWDHCGTKFGILRLYVFVFAFCVTFSWLMCQISLLEKGIKHISLTSSVYWVIIFHRRAFVFIKKAILFSLSGDMVSKENIKDDVCKRQIQEANLIFRCVF